MRGLDKGVFVKVAVALVHHPVLDRQRTISATNITHFDVHDIARACRTYGVGQYFIVHPMKEQLMFVARLLEHWRIGYGSKYNSSRRTALECVQLVENIDEVVRKWRLENPDSLVLATTARNFEGLKEYSFDEARQAIQEQNKPTLVIFGTGYGLTNELILSCDGKLQSLKGRSPDQFNHLSVRSAVSIYLDRLCSAC